MDPRLRTAALNLINLEPCQFLSNLTNELTPWIGVLLEKLTDTQMVKKFPEFYGTRRLITTFTKAFHLSLSGARSI